MTNRTHAGTVAVLLALAGCATPRKGVTPEAATPAPSPATDTPEARLAARGLMVPVVGVAPSQVRDTYTAPRGERSHNALDILAPRGTPVVAAEAGRIFRLRSNPSGGITVYAVDREERFMYYYAHLERYADRIREGQEVAEGEVLGYVGTTGNAPPDTPHLHFQVMRYRRDGRYWDGTPLNPLPFLKRTGKLEKP